MNKEQEKSLAEILKGKTKNTQNLSGVYFLIYEKEIVYVGSSQTAISRIDHHRKGNKILFDYHYILPCSKKNLASLENYYIFKFCPKYNKRISNKTEKYKLLYNMEGKEMPNTKVKVIGVIIGSKLYVKIPNSVSKILKKNRKRKQNNLKIINFKEEAI